jgi:hypothetical protein
VKPEQWRSDMKPEEYNMHNTPNDDRNKGCYWSTLLAIFEETITLPCHNCSAVHRDDFANNYFRVLRGDLGDWSWKKEYGQEVIDFMYGFCIFI